MSGCNSSDNTVENWLSNFEESVNNRDFKRALGLYSDNAILFGSRVPVSQSIVEYSDLQWSLIWNSSQNFRISKILQLIETDEIKTCAVLWTIETEIDAIIKKRSGRATFIFRRGARALAAVHSHFSETPRALQS